jgi:hypothetical protein
MRLVVLISLASFLVVQSAGLLMHLSKMEPGKPISLYIEGAVFATGVTLGVTLPFLYWLERRLLRRVLRHVCPHCGGLPASCRGGSIWDQLLCGFCVCGCPTYLPQQLAERQNSAETGLPGPLVSSNAAIKAVLLILSVGTVGATVSFMSGLHAWAWFCVGFIPFAFSCWALSKVLTGSQDREIIANLMENERQQLRSMARAYGLRMALRVFPVVFILMLGAYVGPMLLSPDDLSDFHLRYQVQEVAACLIMVVLAMLISLPAMVRQRWATTDFLRQTEYSRRKGKRSNPR